MRKSGEELIANSDAPIVGDSDEIIDSLTEFEETCGYEDFVAILLFDAGGITHEEHETQLRSFAEDVLPYLEEPSASLEQSEGK